uniref:Uncharacterized protein n=1 Tax=Romanomermis culicivorax TaxID=13658 RepID=A0A915IJG3_ROMCU
NSILLSLQRKQFCVIGGTVAATYNIIETQKLAPSAKTNRHVGDLGNLLHVATQTSDGLN